MLILAQLLLESKYSSLLQLTVQSLFFDVTSNPIFKNESFKHHASWRKEYIYIYGYASECAYTIIYCSFKLGSADSAAFLDISQLFQSLLMSYRKYLTNGNGFNVWRYAQCFCAQDVGHFGRKVNSESIYMRNSSWILVKCGQYKRFVPADYYLNIWSIVFNGEIPSFFPN